MLRAGRAALVVAALAVLGGCGHRERLAVSGDGRAVLRDAYDRHLDRNWSCGSLRVAYARLPVDGVSLSVPLLVGRAAADACDASLATVRVGMTSDDVRTALGKPDRTGRCWVFSWLPADAGQSIRVDASRRRSAVDGARACFKNGRVFTLQTAAHG